MKILERDIEQYLVKEVEKISGKAYKFSSPGNRGVPDRLCIFPFGIKELVECKKPGEDLTSLQKITVKFMRSKGHRVFVIDTKKKVDIFCEAIKQEIMKLREAKQNDKQ